MQEGFKAGKTEPDTMHSWHVNSDWSIMNSQYPSIHLTRTAWPGSRWSRPTSPRAWCSRTSGQAWALGGICMICPDTPSAWAWNSTPPTLWSFCRPWSRWYNLIWRNNHFAKGFIRNHENSLFSWSFINPLLRIPSLSSSLSPMSSIHRYGPKHKSPIWTSDETKITWATTPPLTFENGHF